MDQNPFGGLALGGVGSLAVNPQVMGKSPYDPFKDFAPIILLASAPSVVAVNLAQHMFDIRRSADRGDRGDGIDPARRGEDRCASQTVTDQ